MIKGKKGEAKTASGVRIYDGLQMESYLKAHPTVLYRYQANTYGLVILSVLAAAAIGLAFYIGFGADLTGFWNSLALALAGVTVLGVIGLVVYWFLFTKIHYLATSDQDLIIGEGRKVVAIDWSLLDAQTLGFGSLNPGQARAAVLSVKLGSARYRLRLFTRWVCLKNLQGFMSTLLLHLQGSSETIAYDAEEQGEKE
ncbi:MAG: hypothetical protein JW797_04480 [Bradymonadales bacterium]|nr:hypothetical protein [Bradymonadales bacterium]